MKGRALALAVLFTVLSGPSMAAGDDVLVFPQTEAEIVDVLKGQEGRPIYVIGGKTVYTIEVQRTRRKPGDNLDDAPKAGALIHFDFGSAKIRTESHKLLDEFGKALKGGLADARFVIAGHTDNYGSESYNMDLSKRRAASVKAYLESRHDIRPDRLRIKGYGETSPIASNDTSEDRQLNRRVEFIRLEKSSGDPQESPSE